MELNITSRKKWKSNRYKKLSLKEKEKRKKEKLYFTYGLPGYIAGLYK
jgi:hypothetical protein